MTTEPLAPDAVRALIERSRNVGPETPHHVIGLLVDMRKALSASLAHEDACRDAEPTPDELFALALDGGGSRGDALVRIWRAGRDSASTALPQEDADLDAIESRAAWAGSYSTDGVQAAAERFRIARGDVPVLLARVRAAEAERDQARASALDEAVRIALGPTDELVDAATCRTIANLIRSAPTSEEATHQ